LSSTDSAIAPGLADLLLGVDVGTTGTKTILSTADGLVLAESYRGYELSRPAPLHVEQDAEDWWSAVVGTIRECIRDIEPARIAAISVSAQGGSVVAVDETGTPLAPARSWLDRRAGEEERILADVFTRHGLYERTGWRLYSAYNCVQLLNMRTTEPALFSAARWFFSTADFIYFRLSGLAKSDSNSAGITQLLDVETQQWDDSILSEVGVRRSQLTELCAPGDAIGPLSSSAAEILGLPEAVVVVAGGHDQYCAALGAGVIDGGDALVSLGTAWVVLGVSPTLILDPREDFGVGPHVVPGRFGTFGSFRNGGVCLDWARSLLGGPDSPLPYERVEELVAPIPAGSSGVSFLPYFDGTNIPFWSTASAGTILGLELRHSPGHVLHAVMEGVCFELAGVLDASQALTPGISRIRVLGGAAQSAAWMQMLADILDIPLEIPETSQPACVGAAILAGVGAGLYPDASEGYRRMNIAVKTVRPDAEASAFYARHRIRHDILADRIRSAYEEIEAE
jgi:sugar (pentulose or hexulose) kinase